MSEMILRNGLPYKNTSGFSFFYFQKIFKKGVKKGYKCLARNSMGTCVQYPNNCPIEEVRKDMEKEGLTTLYTELKDFIHII